MAFSESLGEKQNVASKLLFNSRKDWTLFEAKALFAIELATWMREQLFNAKRRHSL